MNPELMSILQGERDAPFNDEQVYLETNTVLQVSVDIPDRDASDGDRDTDPICISLNISDEL